MATETVTKETAEMLISTLKDRSMRDLIRKISKQNVADKTRLSPDTVFNLDRLNEENIVEPVRNSNNMAFVLTPKGMAVARDLEKVSE